MFFLAQDGGSTGNRPDGGIRGLAHELSHNLGRAHVACPVTGASAPALPDGNYPYPTCQTDFDTPDAHVGFDSLTQTLFPPASTADYMTYSGGDLWVSDYTYRALFSALAPMSLRLTTQLAATGAGVAIGGMLEPSPLIGFAFPVEARQATHLSDLLAWHGVASTTHRIRGYDAQGQLVFDEPLRVFDVNTEAASPGKIFFQLSSVAPTRYEIVGANGVAVLSRSAGPAAPELRILSPQAGERHDGSLDIAWSASDPDGDPLMFSVRYSPDGGTRWMSLGPPFADNKTTVDLTRLPGGDAATVEVVASDGVHVTRALAGPFHVPNHGPTIDLLDESESRAVSGPRPAVMRAGGVLNLRAQAYDVEDGFLPGTALQWTMSGGAGLSGAGGRRQIAGLAPGTYSVEVRARDNGGEVGFARAAVNVLPKHVPDVAAAIAMDGRCLQAEWAQDSDPLPLRLPDGTRASLRMVHSRSFLYACIYGMPLGADASDRVDLALHPWFDERSGPSDLMFSVDRAGTARLQRRDTNGNWVADIAADGLEAAVSQSGRSWNAMLRIDAALLGSWNAMVRLRALI